MIQNRKEEERKKKHENYQKRKIANSVHEHSEVSNKKKI